MSSNVASLAKPSTQPKKNSSRIYLDHNSTMAMLPAALEKFMHTAQSYCNPSALHYDGQLARTTLEESRQIVKQVINANNTYDVIFTASGTEANNTVFKGLPNYVHLIAATEHLSVINAVGCNAHTIPVTAEGLILPEKLEEYLIKFKGDKILVSIMLVNNETGVIQNIKQLATLAHKYGALFHTDGVQALAKIPIDIQALEVDMLTLSSHKIGGGLGSGALIKKQYITLQPLLTGGGQEKGLRSGTENVPAITAFSESCKFIQVLLQEMPRLNILRDTLEDLLKKQIPDRIIVAKSAPRVSNTSCIIIPNLNNMLQSIHFDLNNISVSTGSACSSGKTNASHVLTAMEFCENLATCSIRISLGKSNFLPDIEHLVKIWGTLYNRIKL